MWQQITKTRTTQILLQTFTVSGRGMENDTTNQAPANVQERQGKKRQNPEEGDEHDAERARNSGIRQVGRKRRKISHIGSIKSNLQATPAELTDNLRGGL
jgi:hypothetical protein